MRLFIAIQFSDEIKKELKRFQEDLKANGVSGRFVWSENLHLTLAFIGEYHDPDEILDIMETISAEPFELALSGVGHFQDLYWAGLEDNPELANYVKRLRRALAEHDIPFDRKKFSPHITLIRRGVLRSREIFHVVLPPSGTMDVEKISLMRSDRGKHGMIYTEVGAVDIV